MTDYGVQKRKFRAFPESMITVYSFDSMDNYSIIINELTKSLNLQSN